MTWYAIADSGFTFCRVGTGGAIQTNPNPDDPAYLWTNRTSGTVQSLYGLTWNGSYFVAVGANGTAIYSPDGINWNNNQGGVPGVDLNEVASLSNIVIAVGNGGTIIVSQWGGFWQTIPSGTSEHLRHVSVGDSMYIAVGDNDTIVTGTLYSYDLQVNTLENTRWSDTVSLDGSFANADPLTETTWISEDQVNVDHYYGSGGGVDDSLSTDLDVVLTEGFVTSEVNLNDLNAGGDQISGSQFAFCEEFITAAETLGQERVVYTLTQTWNNPTADGMAVSHAGTTSNITGNNTLLENMYAMDAIGAAEFVAIADALTASDSQPYKTVTIVSEQTGDVYVIETEEAGVWVALGGFVTDSMTFDEPTVAANIAFGITEAEGFSLNDTPTPTITFGVILADSVSFDDVPTINQILNLLLTDQVVITTGFGLGGDTYRGVIMNLRNKAITEYDSYDFNAMGYWSGTAYGTKSDGVYRLEGADDAGVDIAAHILTAVTNFGNSVSSRVERAYLGIRNDGTLTLKVIARQDDDTKVAHLYDMTEVGSTLRRERVKLGKGVRAAYFQFELSNTAGGDFELDEMVLIPISLARRIT